MASNETKNPRRAQMRGPGGPGGAMTGEKAKDFKQAVKRLLKELKGYKVLRILQVFLNHEDLELPLPPMQGLKHSYF